MAPHVKKRRNEADDAPVFRAGHRFAKISPRKVRLVMDRIRDRPVSDALNELRHMRQRGAVLVDRVLKSAIANADRAIEDERVRDGRGAIIQPQPAVDVDDLYVHDARADEGPRLKRWRPRARGAAYPYRKFYAHLSIQLRPLPARQAPAKKKPGSTSQEG